ncbi:MAG: acyl-CoA dehydrogenase family protein [Streptosporangiaceae bacterium]
MDSDERALLAETFRKTMTAASGQVLDLALAQLGWPDLLAEVPGVAIPMVFGLLGETGAQAPLLNDVLLNAAGRRAGGTLPLPYTGGSWVVWERTDRPGTVLDGDLPLHGIPELPVPGAHVPAGSVAADHVPDGEPVGLAAGRRALGWWLTGTSRAMLGLARSHVLDRRQFGRSLASFQAVRHRLAETLVAIEGAEAALLAADGDLGSLLAKAAAGQAALTAARHSQQVLGGIGFTAEHALHRHIKRVLVLDGLLGSTQDLIRAAGAQLRKEGSAPRLVQL